MLSTEYQSIRIPGHNWFNRITVHYNFAHSAHNFHGAQIHVESGSILIHERNE